MSLLLSVINYNNSHQRLTSVAIIVLPVNKLAKLWTMVQPFSIVKLIYSLLKRKLIMMKKNGLLLVNLGSPATPTPKDVKTYLSEFLGDQNVVTLPRWLWQPLLKGIILPFRSPRSAALYQKIWLAEGSPLTVYTKRLTDRIQQLLPDWDVQLAMTYGKPSIKDTLQLMKQHCEHITVLSLFPHYTKSTTDSIVQQVRTVDKHIPIIDRFADNEDFLSLIASHINNAWLNGDYEMLFISYHGIPQSMVKAGDPYQKETQRTTEELIDRLKVPQHQVKSVYQSKFGPMPWLQPYLNQSLIQAAQHGVKRVLVVSPSFVADCLETLEENGIQNAEIFRSHGGDHLTMLPSLNDDPAFAELIVNLVNNQQNLHC